MVIGDVTSGKKIEVGESTRRIGLFPRFFQILSRQITSLLSHRYDTQSVFTMVGRERRDVTTAPGGNENDTKESFDGSDDDELSFDEDEMAAAFLGSGYNASAGGQMMSETFQRTDDINMDEIKITWAELCQEMTEKTCEHRLSTKVWDGCQNLQASSRSEVSLKASKRCRTDKERDGFDDRREVGPKKKKAAYFHNLIDRWKSVDSFGETEVDRGRVNLNTRSPSSAGDHPTIQ